MMALLGSLKVDSFLRAFWASRHGSMEGTKLFSAFKKSYAEPEATYQISIDMRKSAENYGALFSADNPIWSDYSGRARQSVRALEVIDSSQLHPIILSALERFSKHEMARLLRLLEVVAVRYQLVNRGRPGRIESLGGRAARDIWGGTLNGASDVLSAIRELYIPDDEFKAKFRTKTEKEPKKARYILGCIERESLLREGKTFADELVPGDMTVEHIFPKSPKAYWEDEIKHDAKLAGMLYRLGNMCLLPEVNRALGNKPWEDKLETYAKSRLRTTNTIILERYGRWGSAAIEKRQGYMAELAVTAWRFE